MANLSLEMGGARVSNMDELQAVMRSHLERFDNARDHRAAFLRVYLTMTGRVASELQRGFFLDPDWIEQVAVRFARWYFDALDRFERSDSPPPAWQYTFDVARRRRSFVIQDVLLGMNAHINNDLPQVVAGILADQGDAFLPHRSERRRFDHDQINRVLAEIVPTVETVISQHDARLVRPLSRLTGPLDAALTALGLRNYRDNVWRNAQFLLSARDDAERARIVHFIQQDALAMARQVERFAPLAFCRPLAPLARRWRLF